MLDRERRKESMVTSLRALGAPVGRPKVRRREPIPAGRPPRVRTLPKTASRLRGNDGPPPLRVRRSTTKPVGLLPPLASEATDPPEDGAQRRESVQGGLVLSPIPQEEEPRGLGDKPQTLLRFQKVARGVTLLCFLYRNHHLLANPDYTVERVRRRGPEQQCPLQTEEDILFDITKFKVQKQMRLTDRVVHILKSRPRERKEQDVRQVLTALHHVGVFGSYSTKLQRKVARVARYSRFESRQVMIQQGQPPHSFYICLSGSATVIKRCSESGQVKPAWFFTQGDTFGDSEILSGDRWQFTVIIQEPAEFLCIDREDFLKLFLSAGSNIMGDPEQAMFLRTLRFFRGWPVQLLEDHPGKCLVCHFRRGAIILKNSNVTDWIYIVKSGSCSLFKVFKEAPSINTLAPPRRAKQRSISEDAPSLVKPEVQKQMHKKQNLILDRCILHSQPPMRIYKKVKTCKKENIPSDPHSMLSEQPGGPRDGKALGTTASMGHMNPTYPKLVVTSSDNQQKEILNDFNIPVLKVSNEESGINREPAPMKSAHLRPSRMNSMARTEETLQVQKLVAGSRRVAPVLITLGTLVRGSVFGLSDVLFKDQSNLCVVSNGAECLKISKRFYLDHAPEEFIEKLRQHERPYPSDKDLWEQLTGELQWQVFRKDRVKSTLQRIERKRKLLQQPCGCADLQPHRK